MSTEWDLLIKIAECLNNELYDELEELIENNKNNLTPIILDALTELPVLSDTVQKHPSMYKTLIDLENNTQDLGLRASIRFQGMKQLYNQVFPS